MMQKKGKSTVRLNRLWTTIKHNILFYSAGFLAIFIPLYPKLPLVDILPGYNVRLRLEDVFIFLTFCIFIYQVVKQKLNLTKNPLFWPIIIYFAIGFLSILSGIFITKTIPREWLHVAKAMLHLARRIEYMSLFFIFYYAIQSLRQVKALLITLGLTVASVITYGYGQKYWHWPVYSTMNREFAKGVKLYLMAHGRVSSTFGGHYDLAAFIVLTLVLILALAFMVKQWWLKIGLLLLSLLEYWLLILTVSRISFIAYLVAVSILFLVLMFQRSFWWSVIRWIMVMTVSISIMALFGDLSDRLLQVLGEEMSGTIRSYTGRVSPVLFPKPKAGDPVAESDVLPEPAEGEQIVIKPVEDRTGRPADVYVEPVVIAPLPTIAYFPSISEVATPPAVTYPTYSEAALKYGLSAAIRLDALWPRAVAGFKANPLLGAGYSTLTKERPEYFTFAESTDNDFLRMIGETGLLGTISFLSIILILIWRFIAAVKKAKEPVLIALYSAGVAMCLGILANATYIDVFEASKVAYAFWSLMGLILIATKYATTNIHDKV